MVSWAVPARPLEIWVFWDMRWARSISLWAVVIGRSYWCSGPTGHQRRHRCFTIFNPSHIGGSCKLYSVPLTFSVGGEEKKSRFCDEIPEEVDYDDEEVEENPRTSSSSKQKSLFETLGVDEDASQQEIKKAYYKLALRLHPDKNPDDEEAKEKFQQLQKFISILGDEEKRAVHSTNSANLKPLDLVGDAIQNLQIFFRSMYKKISEADIEDFEANYRCSDSEKKDVLKLFKECKGNMDRLFCCMLCSDAKLDSHQFKDIIDESISAGKIESTKAYKKWAKQVSKTEPPTGPLRQRKKSKERSEDLYAIIAQKQNERRSKIDTMFSNLVHKYGGSEAVPEPSEEEFEASRRKPNSRKKSKHK